MRAAASASAISRGLERSAPPANANANTTLCCPTGEQKEQVSARQLKARQGRRGRRHFNATQRAHSPQTRRAPQRRRGSQSARRARDET